MPNYSPVISPDSTDVYIPTSTLNDSTRPREFTGQDDPTNQNALPRVWDTWHRTLGVVGVVPTLDTPWLAYDMPKPEILTTLAPVGTHPMANFPINPDNSDTYWTNHWLWPAPAEDPSKLPAGVTSEQVFGGLVRDRKPAHAALTGVTAGESEIRMIEQEIQWMMDAGLDFASPHLSSRTPITASSWTRPMVRWPTAAQRVSQRRGVPFGCIPWSDGQTNPFGGPTSARAATVTTSGSATITYPSGRFTSADTGLHITGTGIPGGATFTYVNATSGTLSANATASGTITATILTQTFDISTTEIVDLLVEAFNDPLRKDGFYKMPAAIDPAQRNAVLYYNPNRAPSGLSPGGSVSTDTINWWTLYKQKLAAQIDTYSILMVQSVATSGPYTGKWMGISSQLPMIRDGNSIFGNRDPTATLNGSDNAAGAPAASQLVFGQPWFQPGSVSDFRPRGGADESGPTGFIYEARGFDQAEASMMVAINNRDSTGGIFLNTWDDYAEGSEIGVSRDNKRNWLDFLSYYIVWFKLGTPPPILRDDIKIANRPQRAVNGTTTYTGVAAEGVQQTKFAVKAGSTNLVDVIGVCADLVTDAQIEVLVGGVRQGLLINGVAGRNVLAIPFTGIGQVKVRIIRAGNPNIELISRFDILDALPVQDLLYRLTGLFEDHPSRPPIYTA